MLRQLLLAFDKDLLPDYGVEVAHASRPQYSEDPDIQTASSTRNPRPVAPLGDAQSSAENADGPRTNYLVRPDRQFTFDGLPVGDWPEPLHDPESITVDRPRDDIDGPAHRFLIRCGDPVEILLRAEAQNGTVDVGTVLDIDHVRNRVLVRLLTTDDSEELWFPVESIFPAAAVSPTTR